MLNRGTERGAKGKPGLFLAFAAALVWALHPVNVESVAWNNLGMAYQKQGRQKEAQKAFKMATATAPSYSPAYSNLAETEAALGDCRSARAHYLQALSLGLVPGAGKKKHFDNCR